MTESRVRSRVGVSLVLAQLLVLLLAIAIHVLGGLRFDELTMTIALIVPMFAVHTTAVAKYFAKHRTDTNPMSPEVTPAFALLTFLTPALFTSYLVSILIVKAFGVGFGSSEEFKWALGIGQTCFGVYLGTFIGALFDERPRDTARRRKP